MKSKVRIHDGIVGVIYLMSVILALTINIQWIYLAGVVAVLQILSYFTGFCPVYYVLNKLMADTESGTTKKTRATRPKSL